MNSAQPQALLECSVHPLQRIQTGLSFGEAGLVRHENQGPSSGADFLEGFNDTKPENQVIRRPGGLPLTGV